MPSIKDLPLYTKLNKYYINIESRLDRKIETENQVGNDFIRFPAIDAKAVGGVDNFKKIFNFYRCQKKYLNVQLRNNASATLSHYYIYRTIANDVSIKEDDFVLISEDDNKYVPLFKEKLEQILRELNLSKYQNIDLVILKLFEFEKEIDFKDELLKICLTNEDFDTYGMNIDNSLLEGIDKEKIEILKKFNITSIFKFDQQRVKTFPFKNLPTPESSLIKNEFHFIQPYHIHPYSAALYLIRKSLASKIVKKYSRPWWYADDFKQLTNLPNILICLPFLAVESQGARDSNIANDHAFWIYGTNRVTRKKDLIRSRILKKLPWIQTWNISRSKYKRIISKIAQKVLYLF